MSDDLNSLRSSARLNIAKKVMNFIARRDHSEDELRTKLRDIFSEVENAEEMIDQAIEDAKSKNWIVAPEILAQRLAETLHGRNKGICFINNYLSEKGLPPVATDRQLELEKALGIVKNKYDENHQFDDKEKAKMARLLTSRGFDSETVRKVLYEKF